MMPVAPPVVAVGAPPVVLAHVFPVAWLLVATTPAVIPQISAGMAIGSCATLPDATPLLPVAPALADAPPPVPLRHMLPAAWLSKPITFSVSPQTVNGAAIGTWMTSPWATPLESPLLAFATAPAVGAIAGPPLSQVLPAALSPNPATVAVMPQRL